MAVVEKYVVPQLPAAEEVGLTESAWPPVQKIALTMAFAMCLSDIRLGSVPSGCASPGTAIAAHMIFNDWDEDPVVDALLGWLAWASFVARVNNLVKMELVNFLQACLQSANQLVAFASDRRPIA